MWLLVKIMSFWQTTYEFSWSDSRSTPAIVWLKHNSNFITSTRVLTTSSYYNPKKDSIEFNFVFSKKAHTKSLKSPRDKLKWTPSVHLPTVFVFEIKRILETYILIGQSLSTFVYRSSSSRSAYFQLNVLHLFQGLSVVYKEYPNKITNAQLSNLE